MKPLVLFRVLIPLLVLGWTGCHVGPSVRTFGPAQSPEGIRTTLHLQRSGAVEGELLAVRDDGLVLRTASAVVLAPYAAINEARFAQRKGLTRGQVGSRERRPPPSVREELRLLSRFPQGLDGDVLQRLLALHGQSYVQTLQ